MKQLGKLARAYCVERGKHFKLRDFDPADTAGIRSKEHATAALQKSLEQLADLQNKLYAQDQWAVLLIFQGMDASGKDGVMARAAAEERGRPHGSRFPFDTRDSASAEDRQRLAP